MAEYTELVLALRKIGRKIIQFGNPIYKEATAQRMLDAADAIEELSRKYTEERNAAVELTGELASKPRWISVEEALPDQNDGRLYICLIVGGEYDQLSWYELCDFAEGRFWTQESASECHVTHWMPLPEPPKEES